jgi:hypothetical protein
MTANHERERQVEGRGHHSANRIRDDHLTLRGQLDVIVAAQSHQALLTELAPLPKILLEHFDREEQVGGIYEDMQTRCPPMAPRLDALRGEHRVLAEEVDEICRQLEARMGAAPGSDGIDESLKARVTRWIEKLRRHEHDESSMMGDVYYSDEGGRG